MLIGVMADSHDNVPMIRRAVQRLQAEGVACLIHAGDFIAPFAVKAVREFNGPVHGCFGNNDGERAGIRKLWPEICDPPALLKLGGKRILLAHDPATLPTAQKESLPDVMICGHTHEAVIRNGLTGEGGPLHINPGETGGWLYGRPTVVVLDTQTMQARVLELCT